MKIELKSPDSGMPQASQQPSSSAQSAKQRAIAMLTKGGPSDQSVRQEAVSNPTQVSPEELSAIQPSSSSEEKQKDSVEEIVKAAEAPKAEETPKEDPISTQYAVLARKEKALRAKQQQQETAIKAREAAIAAKEAEFKTKESEYQSNYISKDKLSPDNIWNTLAERGISYDQLTEMALNQPKADPGTLYLIDQLKSEIQSLKGEQNNVKKSYEQQQQDSYKQAVHQIKTEAKQLINSDSNFETIKATGSIDDVVSLIEETFKSDGVLLTVEEAAREVEEYLVTEALKLARLSKIQQKLTPAQASKPEAMKSQSQTQQPQIKTLTNSVTTSRQLTARERAIAAFKGQLK